MDSKQLQKINDRAVEKSTAGLSKLTGRQIVVEVAQMTSKPAKELSQIISDEEKVVTVHINIGGEIGGAVILVFLKKDALAVSDLLVGRVPGATTELAPLDKSALMETANILTGNFFSCFENEVPAKVILSPPKLISDTYGAIVDQLVTKVVTDGDAALISLLQFNFKSLTINCYLVNMMVGAKLKKVLGS